MDPLGKDIVERLKKRAEIRRQIPNRKSVQNNEPDRIADLLEEAAKYIEEKEQYIIEIIKGCRIKTAGESEELYKRSKDKHTFAESYSAGKNEVIWELIHTLNLDQDTVNYIYKDESKGD